MQKRLQDMQDPEAEACPPPLLLRDASQVPSPHIVPQARAECSNTGVNLYFCTGSALPRI